MPNVNKFPSSKLKLDEFFLNWLSSKDSQKLVRPPRRGSRGPSVFSRPIAAVALAPARRNATATLSPTPPVRPSPDPPLP